MEPVKKRRRRSSAGCFSYNAKATDLAGNAMSLPDVQMIAACAMLAAESDVFSYLPPLDDSEVACDSCAGSSLVELGMTENFGKMFKQLEAEDYA